MDGSLELVANALTLGGAASAEASDALDSSSVEPLEVDNSLTAFRMANDIFYDKGWTDGLPIAPPIESEVKRFLDVWDRDPATVVTVVPPQSGLATLEKIAVNMVMAGCEPEYLPVIEAALLAMSEERFCWVNSITGTGMQAPLTIISGPIRHQLNLNSGPNALGQGWRANATIGRALRLIFVNIGGSTPGLYDCSTHGHPGKYSYVLVENEEDNPWPPVHTDYGLSREDSAVTVVTGQPPALIKDTGSSSALGFLHTVCSAMAIPDSVNKNQYGDQVLVLGPEHAATIAADGFTKDDIREYVWHNARVPITKFARAFIEKDGRHRWAKKFDVDNPATMIPILEKPDDLIIVVAGGPGKNSAFIPTYCQSRRVTRRIVTAED
ncbi:MAG: hypothetical protein HY675_15765 [Chloroflexi bacterium]|nr:hypothetical protein [Chloroflexota bacterium]